MNPAEIMQRVAFPDADGIMEWTGDLVGTCMVEAMDMLRRIPSSIGPQSPGAAWPAILRTFEDYRGAIIDADRVDERDLGKAFEKPIAIRYSASQMTFMETCLELPSMVFKDSALKSPKLDQILYVHSWSVACNQRFTKQIKLRGWNKDTCYRRLSDARSGMATFLNEWRRHWS